MPGSVVCKEAAAIGETAVCAAGNPQRTRRSAGRAPQAHARVEAAAGRAGELALASVGAGEPLHDGEAEARAAGGCPRAPPEAVEGPRALLLGQPRALVGHVQLDPAVLVREPERHGAAGRGVADRV